MIAKKYCYLFSKYLSFNLQDKVMDLILNLLNKYLLST